MEEKFIIQNFYTQLNNLMRVYILKIYIKLIKMQLSFINSFEYFYFVHCSTVLS